MTPELPAEEKRYPRQTLSYLRTLFDEHGIRLKNKLGQNFLIDMNLIELIVRSADLTRDDLVLEIGSGTGGLTARLAEDAGAVVSVEIDPAFHSLACSMVPDHERIVMLQLDALRNKNEIHPEVYAALDRLQGPPGRHPLKLVANLPYVVAVPVITNLLMSDRPFQRMIVTVQWELAERLMAKPDCKEYGALAVMVQNLADVTLIRRLAPTVFWPRPKVDSAIVRIIPRADKRAHVIETVGDVFRLRYFLRDLYVHRRKNLRGALAALPNCKREKAEVDRLLLELGIDGTTRSEDLDIEQHLRLCAVFQPESAAKNSQE